MVQHAFGDDGRYLNDDWHETRREAHEETVKIEEWSNIDQTKYDLDSVTFDTKKLDRTYILRPRMHKEGAAQSGVDIRELPTIRD